MGTCSYTWEEWDSEKGNWIEKKCQKETWGGSDEFCIFHDPSPEKDVDLFKEKLEEQMKSETRRHDFIGYRFPANWDFSGKKFEIDANFWKATFQDANFSGTTFQGTAYFTRATFQYADFSEATFNGKAELVFKNIGKLDLRYTEFLSRSYVTADLTKILFYRAFIEHVAFIDCTWPKKTLLYEEIHKNEKNVDLSYKELETIYRDLKQTMQDHGDYSTAGNLYYREMEMRRKGTETKKKRVWLELYRFLAGYGEKPVRTAFSSIFTISTFALLYWIFECLQYPTQNLTLLHQIKCTIYIL